MTIDRTTLLINLRRCSREWSGSAALADQLFGAQYLAQLLLMSDPAVDLEEASKLVDEAVREGKGGVR